MTVRKPFLPALVACFGLALFAASCAKPSTSVTTCSTGQTDCSGQCINVMGTDPHNCGACGKTCGAGSTCQSGSCVCGAGQLSCNGACVPSDASNCGMCGKTCSGTQVCSSGACSSSCASGQMQCSGGS